MGKHISLWIGALVLSFTLISTLTDRHEAGVLVNEEIVLVDGMLGRAAAISAVTRANAMFDALAGHSGLAGAGYVNDGERERAARLFGGPFDAASRLSNNFAINAWTTTYRMVFRVSVLMLWAPLIVVMIVAAWLDGWSRRAIREAGFGFTSTPFFNLAAHALIFLAFSSLVLWMLPVLLPPVTMPLYALAAALPLWYVVAHLQHTSEQA